MSYPIEDDLGAEATPEEIAQAEAEMAAQGSMPCPEPQPVNVVPVDLAAAQDQALEKAAFGDFVAGLTAETLRARDALTEAVQRNAGAEACAAHARAKHEGLSAQRRQILDAGNASPETKAKKLALVAAEREVWADEAEKADARKGLSASYGAVYQALLSEARVLRHRRFTLQARKLWETAAVDPEAPVGPLLDEVASYHPGVMALDGLLFGHELERNPAPEAIVEAAEKLLDRLQWLASEKRREGAQS